MTYIHTHTPAGYFRPSADRAPDQKFNRRPPFLFNDWFIISIPFSLFVSILVIPLYIDADPYFIKIISFLVLLLHRLTGANSVAAVVTAGPDVRHLVQLSLPVSFGVDISDDHDSRHPASARTSLSQGSHYKRFGDCLLTAWTNVRQQKLSMYFSRLD